MRSPGLRSGTNWGFEPQQEADLVNPAGLRSCKWLECWNPALSAGLFASAGPGHGIHQEGRSEGESACRGGEANDTRFLTTLPGYPSTKKHLFEHDKLNHIIFTFIALYTRGNQGNKEE